MINYSVKFVKSGQRVCEPCCGRIEKCTRNEFPSDTYCSSLINAIII